MDYLRYDTSFSWPIDFIMNILLVIGLHMTRVLSGQKSAESSAEDKQHQNLLARTNTQDI